MWRFVVGAVTASAMMGVMVPSGQAATNGLCTVGHWIDPAAGDRLGHEQLIEQMAARPVVLLGESHANVEHHRWQLAAIAGLHGQNANMVLGFEAFPRKVQPVLDRWVEGELDADTFLDEVDWPKIWGFDKDLYLPLFHFARLHRIPMVALNVERDFVRRVGEEGWQAIPASERRGLGDPAAASDAYVDSLAKVYVEHQTRDTEDERPEPAAVVETPEFQRFAGAQLTWDRAMAEALASAHQRPEAPLVVGIIGSGHLEYGFGVPHQLDDLGVEGAAVLLPHDQSAGCEALAPDLADAVFVVPPVAASERQRPRLGVMIETIEDRVRIIQVMDDSVAAATDVRAGDVVAEAAGVPLAATSELIEIVQRQAPGTWLPLTIERDGSSLDLVAKFPASLDQTP